jgi:peptidyl-prolyl cis-trans isomerase B (cyclophilin B)
MTNKLTVKITMKDGNVMTGELYPDMAPKTVENFKKLANDGFYNGLTFHRIIPGFVLQGGCPKGDGTGGPGYTIEGEFSKNGFKENTLKHTRGVLSMARASHPDSAGSQFFIMLDKHTHLDGSYAAFGEITEGFDVIENLASTKLANRQTGKPIDPPVIDSISVK